MADALTTFAKAVTATDVLEVGIADYLRANSVMLALVHKVPFVKGTNTVSMRQKGSLTAGTTTEANVTTRQDYTQTALAQLAVAETAVYVELTDMARDWGTVDVAELVEEGGAAVAEAVDTALLALNDGFSVTAGTEDAVLTEQHLREAHYKLNLVNVPGPYAGVLHPTQIDDVQESILDSAACVWGNPEIGLSILNGQAPIINGYKGEFLGVPYFSSSNCPTVLTDNWGGIVCNPKLAMALGTDDRGIRAETDRDVQGRLTEVSVAIYYDAKERLDAAGIEVHSAQ